MLINDFFNLSIGECLGLIDGELQKNRPSKQEIINLYVREGIAAGKKVYARGILDIVNEHYGFLRYLENNLAISTCDVYYSKVRGTPRLRNGDFVYCEVCIGENSKHFQIKNIIEVNSIKDRDFKGIVDFYDKEAIFPDKEANISELHPTVINRFLGLVTPIGFGQRGIIASPPKCGKTTLIENLSLGFSEMSNTEVIVLMIAERPEESSYMRSKLKGKVMVISSSFDEDPLRHVKMTELIISYAKRQSEMNRNVVLFIDSLTRFIRAINLLNDSQGKVMSGGLVASSLLKVKSILGVGRNFREGSLTVIGTMLINTGSKMDDIIFDESKGTSNLDIILDRDLAQKNIFPAVNIGLSSTRRIDLFLDKERSSVINLIRKLFLSIENSDGTLRLISEIKNTKNNGEIFDKFLSKIS